MTTDSPGTKITIVVDNSTQPGLGLKAEHGFSALIERNQKRILFDTGQGAALPHNARVLGIDLSNLDVVVLSHGHYDHTGGLRYVVSLNRRLRVVAHPAALGDHMVLHKGETVPKRIGMPHPAEKLETEGTEFQLTPDPLEIFNGVWFTGWVPRTADSAPDARLVVADGHRLKRDTIPDDISLLVDTGSGPLLLLGCAHAGIRNILEHVRKEKGVDRIHAIIGGTHLGFCGPNEIRDAIDVFEQFRVQFLAPAHCTGREASRILEVHFKERFHHAASGSVFEF